MIKVTASFIFLTRKWRELIGGWQAILGVHNFGLYMKIQFETCFFRNLIHSFWRWNQTGFCIFWPAEVHLLRIRYRIASMDTPPEGATNLVVDAYSMIGARRIGGSLTACRYEYHSPALG